MIDKSIPEGIGFARVPNNFTTDKRLTPTEKLVQVYLLGRPSSWVVHPAQIAEELDLHSDTIKRALSKLQALGYNSVEYKEFNGKRSYSGRTVRAMPTQEDSTATPTPLHQSSGGIETPTKPEFVIQWHTIPPLPALVPPPSLHPCPHPPRTDAPPIKKELQDRVNKIEINKKEGEGDLLPELPAPSSPPVPPSSKTKREFTQDDAGVEDHRQFVTALNFKSGEFDPNKKVRDFPGMVRSTNVHLYRGVA